MDGATDKTNTYIVQIKAVLDKLDDGGRLKKMTGSGLKLDQPKLLDNLTNGSNIDTPMETFLRARMQATRRTLTWTDTIVKHYLHGTVTGDFTGLEAYVSKIDFEKVNTDTVDVPELCYVVCKYVRHGSFGMMSRAERSHVSALAMWYVLAFFAAVIPWTDAAGGQIAEDSALASLQASYSNPSVVKTSDDDLDASGRDLEGLKRHVASNKDGLYRAKHDAGRMDDALRKARVEMWGMVALVVTVNASLLFLHFRRHEFTQRYKLIIASLLLAGMIAMSIRTVVYSTSSKETFAEGYTGTIPAGYEATVGTAVYTNALQKERGYNTEVMAAVMDDTREQSRSLERKTASAEYQYSSWRFKERQTYRTSGVLQLSLSLTLLTLLIVIVNPRTSAGMIAAMYVCIAVLTGFILAVMYRVDSRRMRINWEKVYHPK